MLVPAKTVRVSRPGAGKHTVGLEQNGCVTMKITVHELLHALGIKHEQSRSAPFKHFFLMFRPDRSDFITINWGNIVAGGGSQVGSSVVCIVG